MHAYVWPVVIEIGSVQVWRRRTVPHWDTPPAGLSGLWR